MNKQDTLRNVLISAAVFMAVLWMVPALAPKPQPPAPSGPGQTAPGGMAPAGATPPSPTTASVGDAAISGVPAAISDGASTTGNYVVVEAESEDDWSMGSAIEEGADVEDSPYRMHLKISNVGASIATATMTDHAESLDGTQRYRLLDVVDGIGGVPLRSLTVERININDRVDLTLGDKRWYCSEPVDYAESDGSSGEEIACHIDIHRSGEPLLRVRRSYRLPKQTVASGRHDLLTNLSVDNVSQEAVRVRLTYTGGVGVRRLTGREWRAVDVGIDTGDGRVEGTRHGIASIGGSGVALELFSPSTAEAQSRFSWASVSNIYFTCTVAPLGDGGGDVDYLQSVVAFDGDGVAATTDDVSTRFVVGGRAIDPGATVNYPAEVYVGQKGFDAFRSESPYKERNYYYQISQGFGCCTFPWLVEFMIWLLNGLYFIVGDFGVAIIILVLVVRTLLHPITKKGQINMVRMQKQMQELTPKIEEIKKKYANDKARMNQEMMKLNINPAGQVLTCLPMFLQMPIWVALYISLSNNILIRHKPFLFTWVQDLTAPDALISFDSPYTIPLFGWKVAAFNLLPVLLAISMYVQQKMQPKPKPAPNATDQQKQQQEMMQKMAPMMSIMMFFIFYSMPSGLNLYIMASSIFGAIEQHRIRLHIKEREEAGTLLKPQKKKGGKVSKPGWLAKLEHMADDAKKQQAKRIDRKDKKRR